MFGSLGGLSLLGVLISPLISVHFRFKKIYLFVVHLPYIACWGIIGIVLVSSGKLGVSNAWLLMFVTVMQAVNNILGGFVMLPHQEYTAACIPMHYRGRYSAWSQGIGSISSIGSTLLGGWILYVVTKPMAFGYLFIMAWFFCQLGYVMALFARERPTPIENAPKPWTRGMFTALWRDRPFVKLMIANALYTIFFWPFFTFFINSYGFKELGMIAGHGVGDHDGDECYTDRRGRTGGNID
jgi:hypothetical protein